MTLSEVLLLLLLRRKVFVGEYNAALDPSSAGEHDDNNNERSWLSSPTCDEGKVHSHRIVDVEGPMNAAQEKPAWRAATG